MLASIIADYYQWWAHTMVSPIWHETMLYYYYWIHRLEQLQCPALLLTAAWQRRGAEAAFVAALLLTAAPLVGSASVSGGCGSQYWDEQLQCPALLLTAAWQRR